MSRKLRCQNTPWYRRFGAKIFDSEPQFLAGHVTGQSSWDQKKSGDKDNHFGTEGVIYIDSSITTLIRYVVSPIVLLNTHYKPRRSVTNTILTQYYLSFLVAFFKGLHIYNVAVIVTYSVVSHPNFNHSWQCSITSCRQEKVGFWPIYETHPSSWLFLSTYS